ncbi:MAG: hypothetical protein JW776_12410 [Candidatus Lokiarchaeota archaeon]|nr:hypothetical protein [Candidatus Lokiarchaeota archaeon]
MSKIKKEQIILISIITAIVITAGTLTAIILTQSEARIGYTLLDRIDFVYDSENVSTLNLTIMNAEGSIFISYKEELENIFEAENRFFGKRAAIVEDASNFTANEEGEFLQITYNAPKLYDSNDDRSFYNNLHITIRADMIVMYNITTESGDIYLVFDSVLTQTIIAKLNVFSSSGDMTLNFGDNTALDSSTLDTHTIAGKLDIIFDNVELFSTIEMWNMTSRSGIIDFHFDQSEIICSRNATFNIETDTGRISMRYDFPMESGIQISAITSTGDISSDLEIPGPFTPYQNEFFPAEQNFFFTFQTGTGSIRIKEIVF